MSILSDNVIDGIRLSDVDGRFLELLGFTRDTAQHGNQFSAFWTWRYGSVALRIYELDQTGTLDDSVTIFDRMILEGGIEDLTYDYSELIKYIDDLQIIIERTKQSRML